MADTNALQLAIDTLGENPSVDTLLTHIQQLDFISKFVREYRPKVVALMVAEIERTGKPIRQGEDQIWVMTESKSTKCEDVTGAAETIYQTAYAATGSDEQARKRLIDCLASDGIKHGQAKRILAECGRPELYDCLFTTTVKRGVKEEPCRELTLINTAFTK